MFEVGGKGYSYSKEITFQLNLLRTKFFIELIYNIKNNIQNIKKLNIK